MDAIMDRKVKFDDAESVVSMLGAGIALALCALIIALAVVFVGGPHRTQLVSIDEAPLAVTQLWECGKNAYEEIFDKEDPSLVIVFDQDDKVLDKVPARCW